jgi:hypothetical protein
MKALYLPHLDKIVLIGGRLLPDPKAPRLLFKDYTANLPAPPAIVDYTPKATDGLRNIFLNDKYGCCVIASGYHGVATETGNAGNEFVASDAQIVADYSAIGGFDPSNPDGTDNGCDEVTALNYWQSNGFADGTKIVTWFQLDSSNPNEIMQALYLLEKVIVCASLPDSWLNPTPVDGTTWDADEPDESNGHSFMAAKGALEGGLVVDTWALFINLTWAAVAKDCQVWGYATQDMLDKATQKAPNSLDWNTLLTDAQSLQAAQS